MNEDKKDDHIIHDHPVPPEELARYSPVRDAASEQDIARYVMLEASDEDVKHVEKVKTEYVMGDAYEVWDVTTDKNRWWVLTNATNLYSQEYFPSLDYTLSFHVGLMMRMRSRREPDDETVSPFDEVLRRHQQAAERFETAIEAEDFQTVGMHLRECLLTLMSVFRRLVTLQVGTDEPQKSNFIAWSALFADQVSAGPKNENLRKYLKAVSDKSWQLTNWLTHDRSANKTAANIALHAVANVMTTYISILRRDETDAITRCPRCSSRNMRSHYDLNIGEEGGYFPTCGSCPWTDHPDATNQVDA